jgi:hypothetical protein
LSSRTQNALAAVFGAVLFVSILVAAERGFGWLNHRKPVHRWGGSYTQGFFLPDARCGYRAAPSAATTCSRTFGGRPVFNVVYTTDRYGRRASPVGTPGKRDRHALFFGCSFTFGEGVEDTATLPSQFGRFAPAYVPYNYGLCGYGPQQTFEKLLDPALSGEVPERDGIAVFTYLVGHEDRAIGRMRVVTEWGSSMPMWRLDDGRLVREGLFSAAHPLLFDLYRFASRSETLSYFNVDFPLRITSSHYELVASILAAAAKVYEYRFHSDRFYVLIYPTTPKEIRMVAMLKKKGVRVLDYSRLFDPTTPGLSIEGDGHPTPAAYARVAEQLARDVTKDDR